MYGTDRQAAELYGILKAVEATPAEEPLKIELQAKETVELLTDQLPDIEDRGYIGISNKKILSKVANSLRKRRTQTFLRKAPPDDKAAKNQALKAKNSAKIGSTLINRLVIEAKQSGAKLSSMTQALAYKAIREQRMKKYSRRNRTSMNIAKAQASMTNIHKKNPTRKEIWKGLRHGDFTREARHFLMMTAHDAYMVGTHWDKFNRRPDLQIRATCRKCNVTETMEHILTECNCNGQKTVWRLAEELWEKKGHKWHGIDLGIILTCGLPTLGKNKSTQGDSRLYRIIISDSARLIWLIRNKRVCNDDGQEASEIEIRNKWIAMMNKRLQIDREMTHQKFEKKALSKTLVLATWERTLLDENQLEGNWIQTNSEV
ncbi:hypothetical protein F5876DRAFT_53074 [Lentinula aff. lateritia]|uniref:Uncharacterized protein n=1 Tax=Lentinula aff. lateritia TaxID=2804960 RepID=A0ACC1TJ88_9AGAR|nr:hypothetical protein F5876DRAFT_53074 [Lentinula aff. lateritia]